jgi:hypothetical protein
MAFAAWALVNENSYDVIVLSGDLATTGSQRALKRAFDFLTAPAMYGNTYVTAKNRQPTLKAVQRPIVLVPGNHDRYGPLFTPGNQRFDRIFGSYWYCGPGAQQLWPIDPRVSAPIVLIGADFTLPRGDWGESIFGGVLPGYLGQGRIPDGDTVDALSALRDATQRARTHTPDCAVIWVIHFEPQAPDHLKLLGEDRLKRAICDDKVAAMLCGHSHRSQTSKTFAGVPVYVCGTTTEHQPLANNSFHLVEIDVATQGPPSPNRVTSFRYDPGIGFVL